MSIVPVHMGSPRFQALDLDGFRITDAWFPPGEVLPSHAHRRPVFAVMLEGSFDDVFALHTFDCSPSTVFVEPAGERHENRIQRAGARVLVIQPDPTRVELLRPLRSLFDRPSCFQSGEIAGLARQLAEAVRHPGFGIPTTRESLVLDVLSLAADPARCAAASAQPLFLSQAIEMIHDLYREAPTVAQIARAVGVHRVHLARTFRDHYEIPIATYIRRLRLEWSATALLEEGRPLAAVALEAGFADQSHFTRAFKQYVGVTPGEYRRHRLS